MSYRLPAVVSLAIVLGMVAISGYGWIHLPDDAQIPIHWGLDGRPDTFAPKAIALLGAPAIGLVLTVLFAVLPAIEPRRLHLERSAKPYRVVWIGALGVLMVGHAAAVAGGLGIAVDIVRLVSAAFGGLLVALGNWLPKVRSNFILGIRTPWTLSSERSWSVTHRLAGRGFVLLGLALLALVALAAPAATLFATLFVGLAGLSAALVIVSYRVWRNDPDRIGLGRGNSVS